MINSVRFIRVGKMEVVRGLITIYNLITGYIKISYLLVFLFSYTAFSKLRFFSYGDPASPHSFRFIDLAPFKDAMSKSAVLHPYIDLLAWMIPGIEIAACILLLYNATKKWGYYLSFLLLSVFTAYIIYILCAYTNHLPCVCGGVISQMSWSQHLVFNFFFVFITGRAIYLVHK